MNGSTARQVFQRASLVVLVGATALVSGGGAVDAGSSRSSGADVTINVQGLPSDRVADVFAVTAAPGGGYYRNARLGSAEGHSFTVSRSTAVELAPISLGRDVALYPKPRFLDPNAALNGVLTVSYVRQYLVTVGKWSTGSVSDFGVIGGDVSIDSQWVDANTVITAVATPRVGWHFAHWAIFEAGESVDRARRSSVAPSISLRVDRPVTLVAGFTR